MMLREQDEDESELEDEGGRPQRADPWQPLVDLATPRSCPAVMAELVPRLLGDPWRGRGSARSLLNRDGVPLQLRVSSSADRVRLELIGDPHTAVSDPSRRLHASVASALALLDAAGAEELRPLLAATLDRILPGGQRAAIPGSSLWLAAPIDGEPGAAIYTTLVWGDRESAWTRARGWLEAILPEGHRASSRLGRLAEVARPVSAAIVGHRRRDARAELHVRLLEATPLAALGIDELAHPSVLDFVEPAIGDREIPPTGLLLAIGFEAATGELADVKVQVCGHCVPRRILSWERLCKRLARVLGVRRLGVGAALAQGDVEVASIGMGLRRSGEPRCEVYFKAGETRASETFAPSVA